MPLLCRTRSRAERRQDRPGESSDAPRWRAPSSSPKDARGGAPPVHHRMPARFRGPSLDRDPAPGPHPDADRHRTFACSGTRRADSAPDPAGLGPAARLGVRATQAPPTGASSGGAGAPRAGGGDPEPVERRPILRSSPGGASGSTATKDVRRAATATLPRDDSQGSSGAPCESADDACPCLFAPALPRPSNPARTSSADEGSGIARKSIGSPAFSRLVWVQSM